MPTTALGCAGNCVPGSKLPCSPRQSLDRGYFAPAYIRNLVAEHMAGCDHARRIGALLTLELWHRQFID